MRAMMPRATEYVYFHAFRACGVRRQRRRGQTGAMAPFSASADTEYAS